MSLDLDSYVEQRLMNIHSELKKQTHLSEEYPLDQISFNEHMNQLEEYIDLAGEYMLAYESIIATLENVEFTLSGPTIINLVEVALIMKYKTERTEDAFLDYREKTEERR